MAFSDIQTSLAAGELSPQLYARVDLDKFKSGAALIRNFFVDYRGGVSNRAGTQYIDKTSSGARLIPFIVSTQAAYVLVFTNLLITIYNQGVLVTTVVTPYVTADLFALRYTQSADVLTIVHPSYPPADLSRTSPTVFNYAVITTGPVIQPPVVTTMTAPHSGPYSFGYLVTAVDLNGKEESLPSNPAVKHSEGMNELTNRVVGLTWTAPAQGVSRYNVYKWGPIDSVTMNPATVWGFIGSSQTTTFTDNNIAADFSKQPPGWGDPFSGGQFQSIVVNSGGTGYDGVSGDWPTSIPYVPLNITGDGTGAAGYAVISKSTGTIVGVYLTNPGKNYTNATVTANGQGGTGATFTYSFTNIQPLYPTAVAYLQQRRVFGGSLLKPETLVMSQPGLIRNFNTSPVTLATDSIVMSISAEEVNTIKSFVQVNYGLLAFTTGGSFLINGGTPGAAIDANSPSVQPQVSQGANNLRPIRVNYDVLYGQAKGNRIHNLAFAWQKQSYAGSDVSMLAAHLFDTYMTVDWTYAEEPFKIVWAVRSDGKLLSLTYVPDQEVYAWSRHDTQGAFRSVCSVPEGNTDAVYFVVERYIPSNNLTPANAAGSWFSYIERMAERQGCCIFDAWFLDCALSLTKGVQQNALYLNGLTGNVNLQTSGTWPTGTTGAPPAVTGIRNFDTAATFSDGEFACDFANNALYLIKDSVGIRKMNLTTQAITLSVADATASPSPMCVGTDGFLYFCTPTSNNTALKKYDPTTLLQTATFGSVGAGFLIDATHTSYPRDMVGVKASTNHFVVQAFSASAVSTIINVINVTSMTWAGAALNVTEKQSYVCQGPTVSGVASAYVLAFSTSISANGHTAVTLGCYKVTIPNVVAPSITRIGGVIPQQIANWTNFTAVAGCLFDATDNNMIVHCSSSPATAWNSAIGYFLGDVVSVSGHDWEALQAGTNHPPASSPTFWVDRGVSPLSAQEDRVVKINMSSGAVMWSVVVTGVSALGAGLNQCRIRNGMYTYFSTTNLGGGARRMYSINTLTGAVTTQDITGCTPSGMQMYDDSTGQVVWRGAYSQAVGTPQAVSPGITSWGDAWAVFGNVVLPFLPASVPTIVGQVIQIGCGKITITSQLSTSTAIGSVTVPLAVPIPDDPNGAPMYVAPGNWTVTTPVSALSGLGHLEGKQVWALADGTVVGPLTVTGGAVTIPNPATNIVVGLKYTQQVQSLYISTEGLQEGSDQGKRKQISGVTIRTDCTKGLTAGTDFNYMTPVPELNQDLAVNALYTGDARVLSYPQWDRPGQTCIEQDYPLPATILGIVVEVTPGDTAG